jgi:hypothetical protein
MSEKSKYEAYEKKLQNICEENNLTYRFFKDGYPIILKIMPIGGMDNQMSMLENSEETGFISPDAFILFAIKGGSLEIKTSETFTIGDALFGKLKNLYKNMHSLWLQTFHCEVVHRQLLSGHQITAIANLPSEENDTGDKDDHDSSPEPDDDEDDRGLDYEEPGGDSEDDQDEHDDQVDGDDTGYEAAAPDLAEFAQLVEEAEKIVRKDGGASISRLQRSLNIGYSKAARLMEALEANGVVGPMASGSGMREVMPLASEG